MSTILLASPTPDERAAPRAALASRVRDERERRIAAQVARIEAEVRALRALLDDGEGRGDVPERD